MVKGAVAYRKRSKLKPRAIVEEAPGTSEVTRDFFFPHSPILKILHRD
jgi:hypothetical protein